MENVSNRELREQNAALQARVSELEPLAAPQGRLSEPELAVLIRSVLTEINYEQRLSIANSDDRLRIAERLALTLTRMAAKL